MTWKEVLTLFCDWCDTSDMVETYSITVNGQKYEFEACPKDYVAYVAEPFAVIARVGRRITPEVVLSSEKRYSKRTKVSPMPGTDWRFTSHVLIRMGERHISPMDVIRVAENPEITHTSDRDDNLFIYQAGNIRLTVDPQRKAIITAAMRDEAEEISSGNFAMEGASSA